MLSGCANAPDGPAPISRELPAAPAYVTPVLRPEPKAGESAIAVAHRERTGRKEANAVIVKFLHWYETAVRQSYRGAP